MSEWRAMVDPCASARAYVPGLLVGHAAPDRVGWQWYCIDETVLTGEPSGAAATEAEAQAACDAAAVAWVLIALAKRAAAWAEGIDARLAREYRAASAARDAVFARYPVGGVEVLYDAEGAVSAAANALVRGWP